MAKDQGERPKNIMLDRLWKLYGIPDTPDPAGYIEEFTRQLCGFTDSELHAATDQIVRKRDRVKRTWPSIGECLAACDNARGNQQAKAHAENFHAQRVHKKYKRMEEMTAAEKKKYYDFVDACADGEIELGIAAKALREMAITMRARRHQSAANPRTSPGEAAPSDRFGSRKLKR